MTWRRIAAVARKESIHVARDPRSLAMGIGIPMLLLLLFGYALTMDLDRVPLAVWDQDRSAESREFVSRFTGSRYFADAGRPGDYRAVESLLDRGAALCVLVVPADFSACVAAGRTVAAQFLLDGSDATRAQLAASYAEGIASAYSRDVLLRRMARPGRAADGTGSADARPRAWFNADLQSRNAIVPGLTAIIMMVIAALLTSLTVAREWDQGTMEQLMATPVRRRELVAGKILPYFGIGMLDMVLAVLMGEFLFAVPLRGSLALLFAVSAVFLCGALGLGVLISIVARSQLAASQFAIVATFLPAFLLSGFVFPIAEMPGVIRALTRIVPARYFVTLLRGIYLKGVGVNVLWLEGLLLAVFGLLVLAAATRQLRKRLG